MKTLDFTPLTKNGLNLQSVMSLSSFPKSIIENFRALEIPVDSFEQMLLVGHLGQGLWQSISARLKPERIKTRKNPIDHYSVGLVSSLLSHYLNSTDFQIIYPSASIINLQALGQLAGWHFPSPLKIGINNQWGTWFAYRVVVLCKSEFPVSTRPKFYSPCARCENKPCITSCPSGAVAGKGFSLKKCVDYRRCEISNCSNQCLARQSCPVGKNYQYTSAQINYHYSQSLSVVKSLSRTPIKGSHS